MHPHRHARKRHPVGDPWPRCHLRLGGRDTIHASGGDDLLLRGSGDDRLFGGSGADRLVAGQGDDRLLPGAGNDVSFGGPGNDTSNRTSAGEDRWHGGTGNDRLTDFRGRDRIFGEAGSDRCLATEDGFVGDRVFGGPGTDTGEADPCDRISGVEVHQACATSMPRRMARHGARTSAASGGPHAAQETRGGCSRRIMGSSVP